MKALFSYDLGLSLKVVLGIGVLMSLMQEELLYFKEVYHISEERKFVLAIMRESSIKFM